MVLRMQTAPEIVLAPTAWSAHLATRGLSDPAVMAQAAQLPCAL